MMTKAEALERVANEAQALDAHFSTCSMSPAQLVRWVGEYHEQLGRLQLALADLRDAESPLVQPSPIPSSPKRLRGKRRTGRREKERE